jgi:hypothetical protein
MPNNENPYPVGHQLYSVYETAGPDLKAALLADVKDTQGDRQMNAVRDYVADLGEAVKEAFDPYAATAWGQPSEQDFTCPSGQKCRVRRVDIMDLLGGGILNDLDFLTSMVNETHIPNAGPGKSNAALQGIVGDTKNLAKFQRTMTDVVLRVVIRPELHPVPAEGEPRIDGRVYIDSVQMTDKIALFNWAVTGKEAEEIKQFREQAGEPVGDVATRESVSTETVELPGNSTAS